MELKLVLNQKYNYSQKYQREIALGVVFQYVYYRKFFLPLFLDHYFINILNKTIQNFNTYNQKVWNILYRTNFYVMNYMERSLFLILFAELEEKKISSKLLTFIYIRIAKKYCRKN
ncbi:MAG: hypothetical protein ACK4GJ_02495, partial [bacterium]